jgi:hypothetical protein
MVIPLACILGNESPTTWNKCWFGLLQRIALRLAKATYLFETTHSMFRKHVDGETGGRRGGNGVAYLRRGTEQNREDVDGRRKNLTRVTPSLEVRSKPKVDLNT